MGLCLDETGGLYKRCNHREKIQLTAKHPTSRRYFVLLCPLSNEAYSSDSHAVGVFLGYSSRRPDQASRTDKFIAPIFSISALSRWPPTSLR
jgi:hypothetical protein